MNDRYRTDRRAWAPVLLLAAFASVALAACGSSSGDAQKLLDQTFGGAHKINSGNLGLNLTIRPSGSSTLTGPVAVNFGGPFQTAGSGKLPQSNFSVTVNALGKRGSLGIMSTASNGYVTLQGTSYQLPQAVFKRMQSSFGQLSSPSGSNSGSGALGKLGINPLHWLVHPSIVGDETVGGASTTHIRAGVNVASLLADLNTFLQKASSAGVSGAGTASQGLSPSTRNRVATEVTSPTVDIWTGKRDKTMRQLQVALTVPVTGQISTLLGGLRSAAIGFTVAYSNVNQPQTITAPATVRPYSEFNNKVRSFLQTVTGSLGLSGATGSAGNSGSLGSGAQGSPGAQASPGAQGSPGGQGSPGAQASPGSATGSSGGEQAYTQCIQAAGGDVLKMQRCASLLSGG